MKYFVDANALIWSQDTPDRLSEAAADALTDLSHELWIGRGTIWEIGIKVSTGKLTRSKPFEEWISTAQRHLKLTIAEIELTEIVEVSRLPFSARHRDPFDRLLAVQSRLRAIPVISVDQIFDAYGVVRIWN